MHPDETHSRHSGTAPNRTPQGRLHIIDVECAADLGVVVRVLNLLAVMRAHVSSITSHLNGELTFLRVNARGMTASQGETLQGRVEMMEGVSRVRVVTGR